MIRKLFYSFIASLFMTQICSTLDSEDSQNINLPWIHSDKHLFINENAERLRAKSNFVWKLLTTKRCSM
jgi:hypothetical protein